MSLAQQLSEYISACFTGLWVQSSEHDDALREIAQMCREQSWRLAIWDADQGLRVAGQDNGQPMDSGGNDPLAAIKSIDGLASPESSALLVLVNFHRLLGSTETVQALAQQMSTGKTNRTFIIVLSPVVQVPVELEKLMAVVEHELPDRRQVEEIARGVVRCIYGEQIDLAALGIPAISRASHVEPDDEGRWLADLSPVGGRFAIAAKPWPPSVAGWKAISATKPTGDRVFRVNHLKGNQS